MERFGDMASQIPVGLVFLPVTASLIAFEKLVKTNVLSAFLLSYAISVRIMERKEFLKIYKRDIHKRVSRLLMHIRNYLHSIPS